MPELTSRSRPREPSARDERSIFLMETLPLLWPPPAQVSAAKAGKQSSEGHLLSEFIVLPTLRSPRLLVPARRLASAAAVRHYGSSATVKTRIGSRGLSLILRSGVGGFLPSRIRIDTPEAAATIETYLRSAFSPDLLLSLYLGARRANRKPVLQLLSSAGHTIGFAKLGSNPLTKTLLAVEHEALTRLQATSFPRIAVPRVLHYGAWGDVSVLVLTPLPVWKHRVALAPAQLSAAMREVAAVGTCHRCSVATSRYWQSLNSRLAAADDSPTRRALLQALRDLGQRAGDTVISFGAWHGDWVPWNMANVRSDLLLWDWERFDPDVPLGFDALHHWLQTEAASGRLDPESAASRSVQQADTTLKDIPVQSNEPQLTALLYLAELATRYLCDRQAEVGVRFGDPGTWLVPALTAAVAAL